MVVAVATFGQGAVTLTYNALHGDLSVSRCTCPTCRLYEQLESDTEVPKEAPQLYSQITSAYALILTYAFILLVLQRTASARPASGCFPCESRRAEAVAPETLHHEDRT